MIVFVISVQVFVWCKFLFAASFCYFRMSIASEDGGGLDFLGGDRKVIYFIEFIKRVKL